MSRKIEFFDGAESETVPVIGNQTASSISQYDSDATYEASESGAPIEGNLYYNTTDKVIRYYNGTIWISQVDESTTQTITNKSIDGATNTITNLDGDNVVIDAQGTLPLGTAQSTAGAHQTTLDDHETRIGDNETNIGTNTTNIGTNATNIGTNATNIGTNDTDITNLQSDKIETSEKGAINGVATLDGDGTVPAAQLPSYVDDVLEFADFASFPGTGETGKIYIAIDTGFSYRWTGTIYVDITSKVDSVNSQSGVVVLDTDDISEGTNKYYNETDFDASLAAKTTDNLTEGVTNKYYNETDFDSSLAAKDTDDLTEGTNEYYTEAKVTANTSVTANTAKVSFPEAPVDGTQYARKDAGWELVASGGGSEVAYIKDVRTTGTAGGQFSSGSFQQRFINTLETSEAWVSLAVNQFTLDAGTYRVSGSCPAFLVGNHKALLYNTTAAATAVMGTAEQCNQSGTPSATRSHIEGEFTIGVSSTFQVRHRGTVTRVTDGFGRPGGFGEVEVYVILRIERIG